jgi:GT2 family glycosyltransferase
MQSDCHRGDATPQPLRLGVLVCTYQRPDHLSRCLDGLAHQSRRADDIIVVCRDSDTATRTWLAETPLSHLPIRIVIVTRPGIVAARNAGHDACRTDVLSSIDDDVVPHADWLRRIEDHFRRDSRLGALGGRDHVHDGERFDERLVARVGHLQWFGREIGNHHLGFGPAREVQFLKGANMSFRAQAMAGLRFDTRLCGQKIEAHEDLAFSLAVWKRGWKTVYDPAVLVYHYAGRADKRAYSAISSEVRGDDLRDAARNKVLALWPAFSLLQRCSYVVWSTLVGTGVEPGFIQAIRYTPRLGLASWRRFSAVQAGHISALRQVLTERVKDVRSRSKTEHRLHGDIRLPLSNEE